MHLNMYFSLYSTSFSIAFFHYLRVSVYTIMQLQATCCSTRPGGGTASRTLPPHLWAWPRAGTPTASAVSHPIAVVMLLFCCCLKYHLLVRSDITMLRAVLICLKKLPKYIRALVVYHMYSLRRDNYASSMVVACVALPIPCCYPLAR